mgnify:FL=1
MNRLLMNVTCLFNSFSNLNNFCRQAWTIFLNRIPASKPNTERIRQTIQSKSQVLYYPLKKSSVSTTELNETGPLCMATSLEKFLFFTNYIILLYYKENLQQDQSQSEEEEEEEEKEEVQCIDKSDECVLLIVV